MGQHPGIEKSEAHFRGVSLLRNEGVNLKRNRGVKMLRNLQEIMQIIQFNRQRKDRCLEIIEAMKNSIKLTIKGEISSKILTPN